MAREGLPRIRAHATDVTAACKAAVDGLGITRVPNFMISHELLYVKQGLLPLKVCAFVDWMTPRLRQALKDCEKPGPCP
jgi:DNA-binding transcriptional LysR family regulator